MRFQDVWQQTLSTINAHAIPIVASCMLLTLAVISFSALDRVLTHWERESWRVELKEANALMANAVTVLRDLEQQQGTIAAHREEMRALRLMLEQRVK